MAATSSASTGITFRPSGAALRPRRRPGTMAKAVAISGGNSASETAQRNTRTILRTQALTWDRQWPAAMNRSRTALSCSGPNSRAGVRLYN